MDYVSSATRQADVFIDRAWDSLTYVGYGKEYLCSRPSFHIDQSKRKGVMPMNKMVSIKSRFTNALSTRLSALRRNALALSTDQSGEGYLDMAMKILIIVVIGAAILAIMNTAMPNLFQSLINKVSSQISGITILP